MNQIVLIFIGLVISIPGLTCSYEEVYQSVLIRDSSVAKIDEYLKREEDPIKRANVISALINLKSDESVMGYLAEYWGKLESVKCDSDMYFDKIHSASVLFRSDTCKECKANYVLDAEKCLFTGSEMLRAHSVQILGLINAEENFETISKIIVEDSTLVALQAAAGILMSRNENLKSKLLRLVESGDLSVDKREAISSLVSRYR